MQKTKSFIVNNKIWTVIIVVIVVSLSYYFLKSKTNTETRYVTSNVTKGNIVVSVSGTGQVESSNTININANASGTVNSVPVKVGQEVQKGTLIASVDSRDAKIALETAQLSLDQLKKPNNLSVIQGQDSLNKSYNDSWDNVSSFVIDMDSVVSGLGDLYSGYLQNRTDLSQTGRDKITESNKAYWSAKKSYDDTVAFYKTLSRSSSEEDISKVTNQALETSKEISNAVKLAQGSFDYTFDYLGQKNTTETTTIQNNLTSWTNSSNTYVSSILSNINSITENTQSLANVLTPADDLTLRQAELNVETKQNAYDDCFTRAPFDGIIASLTAEVGQSASGTIGTLISKQKMVSVSLNEIDIAKIKMGQKATLTFSAIDGLTITGTVTGIDTVGTVSSGVVTYNVNINLDVDDVRVKPGMSVSATIITNTAQDVLFVPNSAIKTSNGTSYVEVFSSPLVTPAAGVQGSTSVVASNQVQVQVGLADDTSTEITSGLKEGDIIVTKTIIAATTAKTATTTPSILSTVSGGNNRNSGVGALRGAATGR